MIELPPVEVVRPGSLDEAVVALSAPDAAILAGGTGLLPTMKRRQVRHGTLVWLGRIGELTGIVASPGSVRIGAMTSLTDVAASPFVPDAVAQAAAAVATPQIRNAGTIGGNLLLDARCNYYDMPEIWRAGMGDCLKAGGSVCWVAPKGSRCWAVSSSDLAPVALALDASFHFHGPRGERVLHASEVYRDDGLDPLGPTSRDILTAVTFATAPASAYVKLRRRDAVDFPLVGAAAAIVFDGDGDVAEARIALGAVASAPLRAGDAEAALLGGPLTDEAMEHAAGLAVRDVRPVDNADVSSRYRRAMVPVVVGRTLRRISASSRDAHASAQ